MSLAKEIGKVHNEIYKTVNGNIKVLLPIALTLLDKYKAKTRLGVAKPVEEIATEFGRTVKQDIDATLMRLQTEHPEISPLLRTSIESHLNEIGAQPESRINQIVDYISRNRRFLEGLNQEDFVGILYETMVSTEFDKQDGRFFTPKNIILINVEIMRSLLETQHADLKLLNVCDPCCGSARFLIYWVESIKRHFWKHHFLAPETLNDIFSKIYAKHLFGMDIHREVAGYACWNMLFHGDGATNIANADSLNHYGFVVHWKLVQQFIREFEDKFVETKQRIQQRELQDKLELIESKKETILSFKDEEEIDISSLGVMDLIESINSLLEVHSKVSIEWWPVIQELHRLKDFDSINEIMKFQWSNINEEVEKGFDMIITNPPFGRSENLQISDPFILGQYKLATEAWVGDLTKTLLEKLLEKQFDKRVEDFYLQCFEEMGIEHILSEHNVKFKELSLGILRNIASASSIPVDGTENKNSLVNKLMDTLNREIVNEDDYVEISNVPKSVVKKVANEILFEGEGNVKKIGEFLTSKITGKLRSEWIKIEDVFDYDHKLTLKDSATGDEHTIYFDQDGKPMLFKNQLPKQVLFLEQFLRMVKDGGKVFTVIDTGVLSNNDDEYARRFLFKNSKIHAVVEFPHNAFKAAGTGVKTAVILYEKTSDPPEDYEIFGSLPQKLGYVLNKQDTPPDPDNNDIGKTLCDYREYVGLERLCDKSEEECDWATSGYCSVWRAEIEKVEE